MTGWLTKTSTLWWLFGLFILQTIGFGIIMLVWEFEVIDEFSDPDFIRAHIDAMSEVQRQVHIWTTATLDVAYPLTYGALFFGLALRFLGPLFTLPAIAVIMTDLVEGFVQVQLLSGNMDLLWTKAYLTPAKLMLFYLCTVLAIVALIVAWRRRGKKTA
ncbi:MAG: hypothetical protein MRY72_02280 [Aquisalinus sp.]|nr:hypothetical protein [Aquisalinus sp.]